MDGDIRLSVRDERRTSGEIYPVAAKERLSGRQSGRIVQTGNDDLKITPYGGLYTPPLFGVVVY